MKVKTEEVKFKPITLIIETEEEANAMWHRLQVDPDIVCESTAYNNDDVQDDIRDLYMDMFNNYNIYFKPSYAK